MAHHTKLKTASQVHRELSMEVAIHEVQNGQSLYSASKIHGISRTTLRNRIQNPNPPRVGAPTKFPSWEEDRLAHFLISCSDQGVPLNRHHCLQLFCEVAVGLCAVLANSLQKNLFGEAPKKQRREKNKQLPLSAGALTTHPSFVEELEKEEADKKAKKATLAAKRKAPAPRPVPQKKNAPTKKQRKA